jgi:hypothetical protein
VRTGGCTGVETVERALVFRRRHLVLGLALYLVVVVYRW